MDATKRRLIEAAGKEFAEKGFERATIRSICAHADANIAAVNYHFGDKERLYEQALLEAHRCGDDEDETEAFDRRVWETLTPEDKLRTFIHHMLRQLFAGSSHEWKNQLIMREMIEPTGASEVVVRERIRPRFESLQSALRELDPDLDEKRLLAASFSVVGQCLFYKLARPTAERLVGRDRILELDVEYLADHITRFTLAAVRGWRAIDPTHERPSPILSVAASVQDGETNGDKRP